MFWCSVFFVQQDCIFCTARLYFLYSLCDCAIQSNINYILYVFVNTLFANNSRYNSDFAVQYLCNIKKGVIFMPRNTKKTLNISTSTKIDKDGATIERTTKERIIIEAEPSYIKLYLNTLLAFKDLPKQMSPLLLELLKLMTFADPEAEHGGQLILLNGYIKKAISERLNIKSNTIDHGLKKLSNSGILKRVGTGAYQANPSMFGRGEWNDIKRIRATFDFNAQTVEANIEASSEQEFE